MSVLSVKNLQETFVGGNVDRTASAQVTNPDAAGYIVDGEVVVIDGNGAVYNTGTMAYGPTLTSATTPYIQIVQRNGDNLIWSNKIYGNKITNYRGKAGAQGQEQIYHIGYDGVTATKALDITAGLDYLMTIIENQDDMMWSEQKKKSPISTPSNLVTTQLDLAKAMTKGIMKKYVNDGLSVTACMLNSGAAVAVTGSSTSVDVAHGSNIISGKIGAATGTLTNFAAGTAIRIGATGSGNGILIPTYTIQGAHPTIPNGWILDQPYAGPSNTNLLVANVGVLTAPGANWGVRFTGKALPFRRDFFKFKRVAFTLQMSGFGATPLTKTLDMSYGIGDGRAVIEEESFSKGFQGALNRMTVPLPQSNETFTTVASTTSTINTTYGDAFVTAAALYDCITIDHLSQKSQSIVNDADMPQVVKVYGYKTGAGVAALQNAGAVTDIQNALNDFVNSVTVAFPTVSVM